MKFIYLKKQYNFMRENIDERIQAVLEHGQYIMGPEVSELEEQLSKYVGVKHCITCANGTDAITLSLMSLGIKPNDIVFCPTFTYFATAEAISFLGAKPVFVDSELDTYNMCPVDLRNKIAEISKNSSLKAKAVVSVDLFGLPANYQEIEKICNENSLKLIEDGAQGFGGKINQRKACSFGDIATTSFFPSKPLGCYGDGGAIFTNNDSYADDLRSLRVHGKGKDKYENIRIGMNSRLDSLQAAILLEKLKFFDEELKSRQKAAEIYNEKYSKVFSLPQIPEGYSSSWAQYTVRSDKRDEVINDLKKKGIPTMIYYNQCLHQQPIYSKTQDKFNCPNSETLAKTVFSLPMHGYLDFV